VVKRHQRTSVTVIVIAILVCLSGTHLYAAKRNECVILLHGLGRTRHSLKPIEKCLASNGYTVWNIGYPSTREDIESICSLYVEKEVEKAASTFAKVHFVTHSMGGIVVRYCLQNKPWLSGKIGRIVMLAPPNQGSEVADFLKKNAHYLYRAADGPAGEELSTDSTGITHRIARLPYEIGIIAGNKSWEPWFSYVIPGDDDGKVAVERTKLEEMSDFIVVPHTHTFIMNSEDVKGQILFFFANGKFRKAT
jgi:triacylglycerol lipase